MFSSGPKNRTTATYLAIFLGWAGIHKFYLGYWNVGFVHIALTAVALMPLSARLSAPQDNRVGYIYIAAGLAILLGYFYVRRFHLGHSMARVLNPARILLWPWSLFRYPLWLIGMGWRRMLEEEAERQEERRWQRRLGRRGRNYDSDDVGCPVGLALTLLGLMLLGAVVGAIIILFGFIVGLIAFMAFVAPVASVAIGVIEGVRYLNKSDSQFEAEYVVGQKLWF